VLSTAMYDPQRDYEPGFRYDEHTGICYEEAAENDAGAIESTAWHLPHRRHLKRRATEGTHAVPDLKCARRKVCSAAISSAHEPWA